MKKVFAVALLSLIATATLVAQTGSSSNVVTWRSIKGVITAPGTSNPVGGIDSGSSPWTTTGGFAFVNLTTRSEERRVGKEGRGWWGAGHERVIEMWCRKGGRRV